MDSVPTWIYIQEEWVLCSAHRKHILAVFGKGNDGQCCKIK